MEGSLSAGKSVIETNKGQITEVIRDGKDGYVCKNLNEMIKATKNLKKIDYI